MTDLLFQRKMQSYADLASELHTKIQKINAAGKEKASRDDFFEARAIAEQLSITLWHEGHRLSLGQQRPKEHIEPDFLDQ